jgi:molybdopterin synthase sulfur carrier subunit
MTKSKKITLYMTEKNSVNDLLDVLIEKYGSALEDFLLNQEHNLQQYLVMLVNGRGIETLNGLDTSLCDGDEVSILPAICGG